MNEALVDYLRCPDHLVNVDVSGSLSQDAGFFQFGHNTICYGQYSAGSPSKKFTQILPDASEAVSFEGHRLRLPFDLSQVVDNLRQERYFVDSDKNSAVGNIFRRLYYFLRPVLPVPVRKHLQKARLRSWREIPFPHWPVDFTVETIMERALVLALKASQMEKLPFIWFWPDGAPGCAIMTHDVETEAGRDFCGQLMDLDDSFGIKSSFQIIPEVRYHFDAKFLVSFRTKGFEVNVHDLNHDGFLFQRKQGFLERAAEINRYAKKFQAQGFRAGAMYRNQEWYQAFDFSFDMSVPNVAHLEPQRGGCCTVMPYFIGKILELPLTTTQDYSLYHIMNDYSIELWKQQIELILDRNGLISFITHPDYLIEDRARRTYRDLLEHLARVRAARKLWISLPGEVDRWWRSRNEMKLIQVGGTWRIEGRDVERARIAYASVEGDRLMYKVESTP